MKFVVPSAPGQTVCPSSVGEASLFATGRPSASLVSLHVGLAVSGRRDQFSVRAIDDVEVSVAIRLRDQMLTARIDHHGNLGRIPVMLIVLGELEIPVDFPGIAR